jgi:hypothetical protein
VRRTYRPSRRTWCTRSQRGSRNRPLAQRTLVGVGMAEVRAVVANEVPHPRPLAQRTGRGEPDVEIGCLLLRVSTSTAPLPFRWERGWG